MVAGEDSAAWQGLSPTALSQWVPDSAFSKFRRPLLLEIFPPALPIQVVMDWSDHLSSP